MTTFDRIINVFKTVFEDDDSINFASINENSKLIEDIGLNSIGMLYMAMALEEEFKIKFQNHDFKKLETINDVIKIVESK